MIVEQLFGCHEHQCTTLLLQRPLIITAYLRELEAQPKISDLQLREILLILDENVFGLEVAVQDLLLMHVLHSIQNGPHGHAHFSVTKLLIQLFSFHDELPEWALLDQLHHQEEEVLRFEFGDVPHDIFVLQGGHNTLLDLSTPHDRFGNNLITMDGGLLWSPPYSTSLDWVLCRRCHMIHHQSSTIINIYVPLQSHGILIC